jgi:acyl-CoA reductase-like NAD-dependent aldehyde dehydrogenase
MGPIQNSMQYGRVQGFFDDIEKEGQKIAVGGPTKESNGYFINPTIIDNPKETSRLVVEEPFGTILFSPRWPHHPPHFLSEPPAPVLRTSCFN